MITVSQVEKVDREAWEKLFRAHGDFYEYPIKQKALDAVWSWIFDDAVSFYCLVAKTEEGKLVGLAHFKGLLSPLQGKTVGFLDDLFIDPDYRGKGIVDLLFLALKQECQLRTWPCLRWHTREENFRARAVYDRYATQTDWLTYQMDTREKHNLSMDAVASHHVV